MKVTEAFDSRDLKDIAREPREIGARIAVLIPCYNEAPTIGQVVRQFREQLPDAEIHVFDNNSTDDTVAEALAAGAIVAREQRQGKGYVVQSMFQQVDADVYVMVDGDGTYSPEEVHRILAPVLAGEADMVIGSRLHDKSQSEFRPLNRLGNRLFLGVLTSSFKVRITDFYPAIAHSVAGLSRACRCSAEDSRPRRNSQLRPCNAAIAL